MEDVLPNELLAVPLPPVALIGLQAMSSHSVLWRALSEGGGSNNRQIRWLLIDDPGNDLPTSPKARRTSYEWFIPKGKRPNILPTFQNLFKVSEIALRCPKLFKIVPELSRFVQICLL